jgi:hypothetical protein
LDSMHRVPPNVTFAPELLGHCFSQFSHQRDRLIAFTTQGILARHVLAWTMRRGQTRCRQAVLTFRGLAFRIELVPLSIDGCVNHVFSVMRGGK